MIFPVIMNGVAGKLVWLQGHTWRSGRVISRHTRRGEIRDEAGQEAVVFIIGPALSIVVVRARVRPSGHDTCRKQGWWPGRSEEGAGIHHHVTCSKGWRFVSDGDQGRFITELTTPSWHLLLSSFTLIHSHFIFNLPLRFPSGPIWAVYGL